MQFQKGDRLRNLKTPDWGIGEVLDLPGDNKYTIFFVNAGERTVNTTVAALVKITGKESEHPLLDNLRLPGGGKKFEFKTFQQKVDLFLRLFPKGFYDDTYTKAEREYKVEAHELMLSLLDRERMSSKVQARRFDEICKDALKVVNKTNLIFPNEKMALKDGLQSDEAREHFAKALFDLLYGGGDISNRFMGFASCIEAIGASKWTIQTYFPFITFPDAHMFMKPSVTQQAAEAFAFQLNYKSELNWRSYETLLKFSQSVGDELGKYEDCLKPRDMIDIQGFMWCSVPGKSSPQEKPKRP
jgi:hypothetical protein